MLVAGCDYFGPGPTSRLPTADYRCTTFPFDPTRLDQPGVAERGDDPRPVALRAFLALEEVESETLPDVGWHLVGSDDTSAEFVARSNQSYWSVRERKDGGTWTIDGWGGCQPELVMGEGVRAATWELAPDADVPDATSTSFTVLVHERSCASGQSPEGRIVGPEIGFEAELILIAFGVQPLPGDQECQAGEPARVTVELSQPLGNRQLIDAGTWPTTIQLDT